MAQQKNSAPVLGFYPKLAIVILLAVAASEVAPEAVNAVLLLILLGLVLGHYGAFASLAGVLGSIGG